MSAEVEAAIRAERAAMGDFIAERIAAVKAQAARFQIGEDAAALTIRQLEALGEMIAIGLHEPDGEEKA